MLPVSLGCAIAFVYGIIVGSFLNVCIYRLPAEESIVMPPSHCPKCNTRLKWVDNIPLFSFLWLGRKCRYCKQPISWRYFSIELLTGLIFVGTYLRYGYNIDFFAYILFISAMLVAFFVDADHLIIPDQVVMIGLVIGVLKDVAHLIAGDMKLFHTGSSIPMLPSLVGMAVCAGIFYLIAYIGYFVFRPRGNDEDEEVAEEAPIGAGRLGLAPVLVLAVLLACLLLFVVSSLGLVAGAIFAVILIVYTAFLVIHKPVLLPADAEEEDGYGGAMGGGDINLAAAIGAVIGVMPALVSFFVAIVLGATVGVVHLIVRSRVEKKGVAWRAEIPFGPHMVAGAVAVILAYPQLMMLWSKWVGFITPK